MTTAPLALVDSDSAKKGDAMTTNIFRNTIVICWDDEQQAYIADAPDLPSCTGSGATYTEALDSILEALHWWQERTHRTRQARPEQKQDAGNL